MSGTLQCSKDLMSHTLTRISYDFTAASLVYVDLDYYLRYSTTGHTDIVDPEQARDLSSFVDPGIGLLEVWTLIYPTASPC